MIDIALMGNIYRKTQNVSLRYVPYKFPSRSCHFKSVKNRGGLNSMNIHAISERTDISENYRFELNRKNNVKGKHFSQLHALQNFSHVHVPLSLQETGIK